MGNFTKIGKVAVALVEARLAVYCREAWEAMLRSRYFIGRSRGRSRCRMLNKHMFLLFFIF